MGINSSNSDILQTSYHMSKAYFHSFCHFADKDAYVFIKILRFVHDHVGYKI